MSARDHFPRLGPDDLTTEQREVYDAIVGGRRAGAAARLTDADGHLRGPFNAMLHAPGVGQRLQALGESIRFDLSLSDREREFATLYAAGRFNSPYEKSAHRRLAAAAGLTPEEIRALLTGQAPDGLTERDWAILHLVVGLCDERVVESIRAEAIATLGPRVVVELTILVGFYRSVALLLDTCGGNDDA
jgi:4-carboxymuconolactone decarboxylase